jgi:hypothetical protein
MCQTLLNELSMETTTLKLVLQHVREHFQLNDQHMVRQTTPTTGLAPQPVSIFRSSLAP